MTSFVGAVSLGVLVLQMSGLTLAMHASRQGGELYSVSAAVLLTELLKLALCLSYAAGRTGASLSVRVVCDGAQWVLSTAWPLALPSLLFVAVQQLNLFAATELDAVTFQVTNQMKLLPTAFFSVVALGRSLQLQQWLSLPVLALGVAVVNVGSAHDAHGPEVHTRAPHWFLGLSAALAAALFSGYASVFVERLLKTERLAWRDDPGASCAAEEGFPSDTKLGGKPPLEAPASSSPSADCGRPLLTLNIQLGAWGALIAAAQLGMMHGGRAAPGELLAHFNAFTWAVIWLQALGGLVVGLVLKYTDNIVKGFATAVSILLSCALESVLNRRLPSLAFALGLALVLLSFALFSGGEELLLQCLGPQVTGALSGAVGAWVAALARQGRQLAASSAAAAMVCASVALVLVILSYVHLQQAGLEASGLLDARVESVHGLRAPEPPLLAASSSSNNAAAAAALPLASEPPPPLHAFSSEAGGGGLGAHDSVPMVGGITTLGAERLQDGLLAVHAPTAAVSTLYPAPADQLELQGRDWDDDVREAERAASADDGAAAAAARTEGFDEAGVPPAAQVHLGAAAAAQRAGGEAPDGSQRQERSSVAKRAQPLDPLSALGAGPAADAAPLVEHARAGRWANATGAEGPPGRAWQAGSDGPRGRDVAAP